jgi:hypothetical protein
LDLTYSVEVYVGIGLFSDFIWRKNSIDRFLLSKNSKISRNGYQLFSHEIRDNGKFACKSFWS